MLSKVFLAYTLSTFLTGIALAQSDSPTGKDTPLKKEHDPRALKIIEKVQASLKAVETVRYDGHTVGTGVANNFIKESRGKVLAGGGIKYGMPARFYVEFEDISGGESDTKKLTAGGNSEEYFLIDHAARICYSDMDPAVLGTTGQGAVSMIMTQFLEKEPLKRALSADKIELTGEEEVGGVPCHVIQLTSRRGSGRWLIGKDDYLPRRHVQMFDMGGRKGAIEQTITNLEVNPKHSESVFRVHPPAGFTVADDFAP